MIPIVLLAALVTAQVPAPQPVAPPRAAPTLPYPGPPAPSLGDPSASAPSPGAPSACAPTCGPLGCCNTCGMEGNVWLKGEYLLWGVSGQRVPALVTGSTGFTPGFSPAALDDPNARVLFGNGRLGDGVSSGFRVSGGAWLDEDCLFGVQASFFRLGGDGDRFRGGSADGSAVVSRPFFNVGVGRQDAEIVSLPGDTAGFVSVEARRRSFYGADALARCNLCCECDYRLDVVAGYRWLNLGDSVDITENLTPLTQPFAAGTNIVVRDSFRTTNNFHGGTLGLSFEKCLGDFALELSPRLGVGATSRTVTINGSTTVSVPGATTAVAQGGLLALSSNIGTYHSTGFSLVPELDATVSYRLTPHVRVLAGYTGIWWTRVARAGGQIDTNVNRDLVPPVTPTTAPLRPAYQLHTSDVWAQGLRLGVEVRF